MNKTACVLIHGFGGDLSEIEYLENHLKAYLINENIADVFSIELAGHGGAKNDLGKTNKYDWLCSVNTKVDELKYIYSNIIVIGFSMGGLIGSQLAAEKLIDRLILINTPFHFWNIPVILRDVMNLDIDRYVEAAYKSSIKSCVEFLKVLEESKKIFQKIECPALIIQCSGDETVPPQSALEIKKRINGQAELKKYHGGRHRVFLEKDCVNLRDEICQDITDWIKTSLKLFQDNVKPPKIKRPPDPDNQRFKELLELAHPDRLNLGCEGNAADIWWTAILDRDGWRLQQNMFGNYRIIDPDDRQYCDSWLHGDTDRIVKKAYDALFGE